LTLKTAVTHATAQRTQQNSSSYGNLAQHQSGGRIVQDNGLLLRSVRSVMLLFPGSFLRVFA
jgi:hypothetical protein